jgi:hypothetical protein
LRAALLASPDSFALEMLPANSMLRARLLASTDDFIYLTGPPSLLTRLQLQQGGYISLVDGSFARTVTAKMRAAFAGLDYVDPFTNVLKKFKAGERMAVDHIFPASEIAQLPGFDLLTKAQQVALLQDTVGLGNLAPLPQYLNASKGARLDWVKYGDKPLNATYAANLAAQQKVLEAAFKKQIATFRKANGK